MSSPRAEPAAGTGDGSVQLLSSAGVRLVLYKCCCCPAEVQHPTNILFCFDFLKELMTKLITETPDQPIPFLIDHLQSKQGNRGQLQRTLSGSAALWAETETPGMFCLQSHPPTSPHPSLVDRHWGWACPTNPLCPADTELKG